MRVVAIVARIAPRGSSIRGKFVLSSPRGYSAKGTCTGCPQQRYATGEPGNVQGRDRVGFVEGGPGVSIRGKIILSRNTRGVAIWLNVAYPGSLPRSGSSDTGPSSSCGYY